MESEYWTVPVLLKDKQMLMVVHKSNQKWCAFVLETKPPLFLANWYEHFISSSSPPHK